MFDRMAAASKKVEEAAKKAGDATAVAPKDATPTDATPTETTPPDATPPDATPTDVDSEA